MLCGEWGGKQCMERKKELGKFSPSSPRTKLPAVVQSLFSLLLRLLFYRHMPNASILLPSQDDKGEHSWADNLMPVVSVDVKRNTTGTTCCVFIGDRPPRKFEATRDSRTIAAVALLSSFLWRCWWWLYHRDCHRQASNFATAPPITTDTAPFAQNQISYVACLPVPTRVEVPITAAWLGSNKVGKSFDVTGRLFRVAVSFMFVWWSWFIWRKGPLSDCLIQISVIVGGKKGKSEKGNEWHLLSSTNVIKRGHRRIFRVRLATSQTCRRIALVCNNGNRFWPEGPCKHCYCAAEAFLHFCLLPQLYLLLLALTWCSAFLAL